MSNSGYVRIFHDLIRSDLVLSAPVAYRWVLITIIDRVVFEKCSMDDHGKKIHLKPGQYLTTIRELADLAKVEKNDVERALKYFSEIVRQEVRHRKTVLTILWGMKLDNSETRNETKKRQERDTKEEHKNKRQQQPNLDDVGFLGKKPRVSELIQSACVDFSEFDVPFLNGLVRKHQSKCVFLALDEYAQAKENISKNPEKTKPIDNPRGFFTSLVKKHNYEILHASEATR